MWGRPRPPGNPITGGNGSYHCFTHRCKAMRAVDEAPDDPTVVPIGFFVLRVAITNRRTKKHVVYCVYLVALWLRDPA